MAKMYHPNYERHRDRPTRITFLPEKLDGKQVATADVPPEHVKDLLDRGYKPWPSGQAEKAVATVPDPAQVNAALEGATAGATGAQDGQEGQQATDGTGQPPEGQQAAQGEPGGQQEGTQDGTKEATGTGDAEKAVADPRPTEAATVAEIRAYADRHGITLPNRGNKQELLQRIDQATPDT